MGYIKIFWRTKSCWKASGYEGTPQYKDGRGNPVRDHVLKMIAHLNELEILGAEIDGESQVDIVLCLNYSMSKESYSLAELLKELQAAKGILGHAKSVQVVERGSSSAKKIKKKKRLLSQVQAQSRNPR